MKRLKVVLGLCFLLGNLALACYNLGFVDVKSFVTDKNSGFWYDANGSYINQSKAFEEGETISVQQKNGDEKVLINPEHELMLNEDKTGWQNKIHWKITDVHLVEQVENFWELNYARAFYENFNFLNEKGMVEEKIITFKHYYWDNGKIKKAPKQAEFAILLVTLEVRSDLEYEYDFEVPLRIRLLSPEEDGLYYTYENGSDANGLLYSVWGEGIPFYVSCANDNGSSELTHYLFCKLRPKETRTYEIGFLVDMNVLENTWLSSCINMNKYNFAAAGKSFFCVSKNLSLTAEEEGK